MSARQKTISHLQRLVAGAAMVGTAACNGCGGSGYAVVDPMPVPARHFAQFVTATVTWIDGGSRVVLEVKDPSQPGTRFSAKGSQADAGLTIGSAVGGRIAKEELTADGMRFELDPSPGRGGMTVDMNVDGPEGLGTVQARVDWGSTTDGGRALVVTMVDY